MDRKIESGVQFFSRIKSTESDFCLTDINPNLFEKGAPNLNEIVEVVGEFSTDLLIDFLVRCILPTNLHADFRDVGVVLVNTSHHISVLKITSVLDSYLKFLHVENRKSVIEKALSNITILNCYGEPQIEMTFRNLEKIVQDRDNVRLILIDDLTSQYWIAKESNPKLSLEQFGKQNLQLVQSVVRNLNILLVFSRYQLSDPTKTVDMNASYKIVGEKIDGRKQFIVIDYLRKTTRKVPFQLETFINYNK